MKWTMLLHHIGFTCYIVAYLRSCAAYRNVIHIGLLFDDASQDLQNVVKETVLTYNSKQRSTVFLKSHEAGVDIRDSFNYTHAVCKLLTNGAAVLIGVSSREVEHTIQAYTSSLEAPFLLLNSPTDVRSAYHSKYQLYMQPSHIRAVVDVIASYEWQEIIYVYDSDEALTRIAQLQEFAHMMGQILDVEVRFVTDPDECYRLLAEKHESNFSNALRVLLDLSAANATRVIRNLMANQNLLKMMFHFVIPFIDFDELTLDVFRIGGVNITTFQLDRAQVSRHTKTREAYAIDAVSLLNLSLGELQHEYGSSRINHSFSSWRRRGDRSVDCTGRRPWQFGNSLTHHMYKKTFEGNSGKVAFSHDGQRKDYQLHVMEVSMYRGAAHAGFWNESGFHPQTPQLRWEKGSTPIDNTTRIVVSIEDRPYLMNKTYPEQGIPLVSIERFKGFCVDLAEMVARNVGYDYHLRLVKDGNYGSKSDSGLWNGMIGELIRHEAHIAIAPLTITSEREKVLDFTKPYMSLGISIMIKKPENEPPRVFSFMEPLSQEIWLCTAFAFIGVSVVLFLVSRFSTEEWQVEGEEQKLSNDFTIGNSLWFSLGAFMQQGCDVLPKSISGRMVTSVWWFFTLIIISSYTANLAAYLTTMRMIAPISSAEDLAKQTEIKYGTSTSGSTWAFFNGSTVSLYQRMWSFMTSQKNVFVANNKEGISKVRSENGKYAFLIESTTNDYHNTLQPCDTMKVGNNLDSKGYGIATPMGSDIRDLLTLAILELREQGRLEEIRKQWWYAKSQCPEETATVSQDSKDNALTLTKVAGIFYILIVGLGLSVLSAVCEFLYKTKVDSKRQNVSFGSEARSKFRLSISGHSDDESVGVRTPLRTTGTTFSYTGTDNLRKTQTVV